MNEPSDAHSEKHLDMYEAIQGLDEISRQLKTLIGRLEGVGQAGAALEEELGPTFMDVLGRGPGEIREKTKAAHEAIDHLTKLLF